MSPRWKAFAIWLTAPYLAVMIFALANGASLSHDLLNWCDQRLFLLPCIATAFLGTLVLWLFPIRRNWVGGLLGLGLGGGPYDRVGAAGNEPLGGFEANIGILFGAILVAIPSCAAGTYGGFLRADDQRLGKKEDLNGWWPSPKV